MQEPTMQAQHTYAACWYRPGITVSTRQQPDELQTRQMLLDVKCTYPQLQIKT